MIIFSVHLVTNFSRETDFYQPMPRICYQFFPLRHPAVKHQANLIQPDMNDYIYMCIFYIYTFSLGASSEDPVHLEIKEPFSSNGFRDLLLAFKGLLANNYPAACLALGGTVMSLGYQRIIQAGGSCPVVLLTGDTETSKTTVLKACISVTGNAEARG